MSSRSGCKYPGCIGAFGIGFRESFGVSSKNVVVFVWAPKHWNGGHSVRETTMFMLKFVKMQAKRAKCFCFYVKFLTKLEKEGSLGVD